MKSKRVEKAATEIAIEFDERTGEALEQLRGLAALSFELEKALKEKRAFGCIDPSQVVSIIRGLASGAERNVMAFGPLLAKLDDLYEGARA